MTEIENVIWDGEALLDASVFEENGYADRGMMLLRNRFFKTCAFNTNLQQWFADNCITQTRPSHKKSERNPIFTPKAEKYGIIKAPQSNGGSR